VPSWDSPVLRLTVNRSRCTGCRFCESACAFGHDREFSPVKARIRVGRAALEELTFHIAVCRQCTACPPLGVCPTNALTRDPATGVLHLDVERCPAGCRLCAEACQLGAFHHDGRDLVLCDLCDGDPACVRACYTEALFVTRYRPTGREAGSPAAATRPR